ncbi:MAG: PspC domain-containing protein [Actinobacteria bacterium]|nr:MAG: PspC domain-containing protein [Actinomycetota bacterium]
MTEAAPAHALRRDPANGIVAGVCAGLARQLGVDPLLVRAAFVGVTFAGGLGIALYALAWMLLPADEGTSVLGRRRLAGRGAVEVALGVGLLVLSALLAFRALGFWSSDALVWPVVLVAAGAALLWRESAARPPGEGEPAPPAAAPAQVASRTGLGIALVVAAGLVFLAATGALSAARDVVLSVLVVAAVLAIIFAPWILRLARSLAAERGERIRSEERAEMAAHLHDSVLQTLALVQQRADDPRTVGALARRQERELRAWLSRRAAPGTASRLSGALEGAASEVERDHGVPVEVVAVGDADLDDRGRALVAAAREAMVNAAKFGGGSPVDVYAEVADGEVEVYVRDRGPGFDPAAVPADRRGVRESIVGRMERHGGRATVRSAPGEGTEVELALPR